LIPHQKRQIIGRNLGAKMELDKTREELLEFLRPSYPDIQIRVERWDEDTSRMAIYFTDPKFALIYPLQRFHYLSHLIPSEYHERKLANTIWFELAPGESPTDLRYPDEQLIASITPDVMKCVLGAKVFDALDDLLCPIDPAAPRTPCYGDFRTTKSILLSRGFNEDDLFDVLHVFMDQGGYCDCEILFNVVEGSRLGGQYWKARAEGRMPYDPHEGA
jgi:hypothetical protein